MKYIEYPNYQEDHKDYPLNDAGCAIRASLCKGQALMYKDFIENHKCDKKSGCDITWFNMWCWKVYETGLGSAIEIECRCGYTVKLSPGCPGEHT